MSRPLGGFIGHRPVPAAAGLNSAAGGVWTLQEAQRFKGAATWPITPPGGVGSGLQLWLDAAAPETLFDATSGGSLVAADGAVARWQDKSGNARHATQATSGSRPLRKTSQQGGLGTLSFDGSNDVMSLASSSSTFAFLHQADSTVFLVSRAGTNSNPNAHYAAIATGTGTSGSPNFQLSFEDRNLPQDEFVANEQVRVIVGATGDNPAVNTAATGLSGWTPNTYNLVSVVTRPSNLTASQRVAARINGGTSGSGNTFLGTASTGSAMADLHIGSSSGGANYWSGNIAEIIIYDSALSDANRSAVESYLMSKWGIS
jgi:hypothetical protein